MRILHLSAGNLHGGVETLLETIARWRGATPEVEAEFALCFEGEAAARLRGEGVRVHILGPARVRNPLSILNARRQLRRLLAERRFDAAIAHSAWIEGLCYPAIRAFKVPLVFWMHDAPARRHWTYRWAARAAPALAICNTRFTRESLPLIHRRLRAEVIYCPVAAPASNFALAAARAATRAELGTAADAVVIIQASRMERWKGQALHLEALGMIAGVSGWECWFVGGPQRAAEQAYFDSLVGRAGELGLESRVRFLGQRPDVGRLLGAGDIYCQPNFGPEPFGIVFIEAMYAALPVVTTAIGGVMETVDERLGILVPANDPAALAAALRRLIEDGGLRKRLGERGPARAAELCEPGPRMRELAAILKEVVAQGRAENSGGAGVIR